MIRWFPWPPMRDPRPNHNPQPDIATARVVHSWTRHSPSEGDCPVFIAACPSCKTRWQCGSLGPFICSACGGYFKLEVR
jgi:hypothetical protein